MARGILVERVEQQVGVNRAHGGSFPAGTNQGGFGAGDLRLLLELRVGQSLPTQPARLGRQPFAGAGLRGVNAQNTFEPAAGQFGEGDFPGDSG